MPARYGLAKSKIVYPLFLIWGSGARILSLKNSKLLTQGQDFKTEMISGTEKGTNESENSRDKGNHEPDLYHR